MVRLSVSVVEALIFLIVVMEIEAEIFCQGDKPHCKLVMMLERSKFDGHGRLNDQRSPCGLGSLIGSVIMGVLVRVICADLAERGNDEAELDEVIADLLSVGINQTEPLAMRGNAMPLIVIMLLSLWLRPACSNAEGADTGRDESHRHPPFEIHDTLHS